MPPSRQIHSVCLARMSHSNNAHSLSALMLKRTRIRWYSLMHGCLERIAEPLILLAVRLAVRLTRSMKELTAVRLAVTLTRSNTCTPLHVEQHRSAASTRLIPTDRRWAGQACCGLKKRSMRGNKKCRDVFNQRQQ